MANFIKINDLGKFSDFNALWSSHPEGGREGDWVLVNGTPYGWDKFTRNWSQMNVVPSGGESSAESVEGDLNVGGNLNVAGDATIDGTLTVGDIKIAGSQDRFRGQSIVTSFVFARSNTKPTTPVGGSFGDPQPDGTIWHDGIPQGSRPIWMSSRVFTSDGKNPQEEAWSDPALMHDVENFEIRFSPNPTHMVPPIPTDNNMGSTWFDPKLHPGAAWSQMNWMATRTKTLGNDGNTTYSNWTIVLIRGEAGQDGSGVEYAFYRTKKKTAPTFSQTQSQADEYLPTVTNKATCEGEGNTFTDNPKGVDDTYKYEWVIQRLYRDGSWGYFSTPALWATYSETHNIYIDENGHWVIDDVDTGVNAVGTGVAVKGIVDHYSTEDTGYQSGDTTLEEVADASNGDCWVVDSNGHLYLFVGEGEENEDWEDNWHDLGEFKGADGSDGTSQFIHLAWATNVNYSGNTITGVEGFTTDPAIGQNYGWMGVCVNGSAVAPTAEDYDDFEWNYLRGMDGTDFEHVFVRTDVLVPAPTITESAVQTNNHCPLVGNAANLNGNVALNNGEARFTDNPNGVSEPWPYEWMAKRTKANGLWGVFTQPVLWAKYGEDGADGESQPWVKAEKSQVVIDADKDGKIAQQTTVSLKFWLYYGESPVSPVTNNCSASYGGSAVTIGSQAINPSNPYITVAVTLQANVALTSKDLLVTLANANHSASVTVPIVINRKGADGATGQQGPSGPALRLRGAWDATTSYTYNSNFRDCVKHGSNFWVLTSQQEGTTAEPGTTGAPWTNMGNTPFVATELLLAESAFIELLAGNSIKLFNADGNKTAGINEDQHGSYVLYYPLTGKKMMEFSYTGYIIYYNNDSGNTVRWVLGSGGTIDQGTTWESLWWGYIGSSEPTTSAVKDYELIERFRYESNSAADIHNGKIYVTKDATSPSSQTIAAGYYTPNETPVSDGVYNKITVYHVSGGKVIGVGSISTNGNYTETPVSGDDGLNPFTPGVQPAQEQQQGGQS